MADGSDGPILTLRPSASDRTFVSPSRPSPARSIPKTRRAGSQGSQFGIEVLEGRDSTVRTVSSVSQQHKYSSCKEFSADGTADGRGTAVPRPSAGPRRTPQPG